MSKESSLKAGLKALAQPTKSPTPDAVESDGAPHERVARKKTVLVGWHFPPQVSRALLLVRAHPRNEGKTVKDLLGEAINDLCTKYGIPEPARTGAAAQD